MRSSGSKTDRHGIRPSESASTLSVVVAKFILPGLVVITVGTMIRESIFLQSKILEPMMGKEDVFYANVDASNLIRSSSNSSSSTSSSTSTSMISASPAKVPVPTAHMQGEEKPQNTLNSNANANATITILPDNKTTSKHTNSSGTSMKSASPTKAPVRTAHMQGEEQPQKSLNSNATSTITAIPPTNPTKGKRTLYLHIGPLKTGTTTIQAIMRENKIKNAAKLDGIALRPAETFERKIDSCFTKTKTEYKNCKTILQAYFDSQDADTVFLSHELLGNTAMTGNYWSMLMSVLEDNWHIRIVLGYRRYYAWKTSMANQIFKLYWNVPPDKESDFVEDALSVQKLFSSKKFEWERPFTKFQFYKNQGPGVFGVINLHDPSHMQNHLAERVFCEIVETAPNLCKAVRSYVASKKKQKRLQKNPSQAMACKSIALTAVHTGVVPLEDSKKYKRHVQRVNCYVSIQASAMGYDCANDHDLLTKLPRVCLPSSQKEAILNRTLTDEASAVPQFFRSPAGETALREEFADADQKGKFCSVDIAAVIADEKWKEIFAGFDPEEAYCLNRR